MSDAQVRFEVACTKYDVVKELIRKVQEGADVSNDEETFSLMMRKFDVMLQGFLLQVSLKDGYYLKIEQEFISKLTDFGDIMDCASVIQYKGFDYSWDSLMNLSDEKRDEVFHTATVTAMSYADDLLEAIAEADVREHSDLGEQIGDCIKCISLAFCESDGDSVKSGDGEREANFAMGLIDGLYSDQVQEYAQQVKDRLIGSIDSSLLSKSNRSTTGSARSLKEVYLKKRCKSAL